MVFFRHLYYIRVPFVDGSPEYSWLMDPALHNDKDKLLAHLRKMNVCWVVKAPDYPAALEPAFSRLEADGDLVPVASTDVDNLTGTGRIYGQRQKIHVALLSVVFRGLGTPGYQQFGHCTFAQFKIPPGSEPVDLGLPSN